MRRFLIFASAVVVAYAAWQWNVAVREQRRLNWAVEARTIVLACDLSKPGKYCGTLEKRYRNHHADEIRVVVDPPFLKEGEAKESLSGLRASLAITSETGESAVDGTIVPDHSLERLDATGRPESVFQFHLNENGTYQLELEVIEPAQGLAGRQHHLEGRYFCCGLEQLSIVILYGWAGLLTVVGGPLLIGGLCVRRAKIHPLRLAAEDRSAALS